MSPAAASRREVQIDLHKKGRLESRPGKQRHLGSQTTGLRDTGLETDRDGKLYVPTTVDFNSSVPFLVMLHGAGGNARQSIEMIKELVDRTGTIVLAPESQGKTWDINVNDFGADVSFIDEALSDIFSLYRINPEKLAIGGFSDGASYALTLGLTNGDLFSHVLAFSPGFHAAREVHGSPRIFISHGDDDRVLPIDNCSRRLVPKLKSAGFDVDYREFKGGHTVPTEIGRDAFKWFLGGDTSSETKGAHVHSKDSGAEFT